MLLPTDFFTAQRYGREAALSGGEVAENKIDQAAQFIVLADDAKDRNMLHFYFEEGSRNYAGNQDHQHAIMKRLDERINVLIWKIDLANKQYIEGI